MDFSAINQVTTKSFNEQKNLIKRVFKGKPVQCPICQKTLQVVLPDQAKAGQTPGIFCPTGCTDIELELEMVP